MLMLPRLCLGLRGKSGLSDQLLRASHAASPLTTMWNARQSNIQPEINDSPLFWLRLCVLVCVCLSAQNLENYRPEIDVTR